MNDLCASKNIWKIVLKGIKESVLLLHNGWFHNYPTLHFVISDYAIHSSSINVIVNSDSPN